MRSAAGIGLSREADFLRRRNNKSLTKQKKMKSIKLKGFHLFFIFSLLCLIGYLTYRAARIILDWSELNIKSFTLLNTPVYNSDRLNDVLHQYSGNILVADLGALRDKLLTLNEVKDVSLSRKLPSTIEINFVLRKPVFQFRLRGKYNIIDNEGVVLFADSKRHEDLITIQGLADAALVGKLIPYLPELTKINEFIEYISYKKPYGIVLKLKNANEIFYPGDSDYAAKINCFFTIKKKMELNKKIINYVDLRFENRIYLEYKEGVMN